MTLSMTAFARSEYSGDFGSLMCEIRTVNHRYLEITPRLPEDLRPLEPMIRELVSARLGRGKVDVGLRFKLAPAATASRLQLSPTVAAHLSELLDELGTRIGGATQVDLGRLLQWPGLVDEAPLELERVFEKARDVVGDALDQLIAARQREGAALAQLIRDRLDGVKAATATVREHLPEIEKAVTTRLRKRLDDLAVDCDPGRLEQELAIQLQKLDVAEELDRLLTHVDEVSRVLELKEPMGRRLDFLMQELNREANTLGSKAADTDVTAAAVELKVLIEQMREQVQNIE